MEKLKQGWLAIVLISLFSSLAISYIIGGFLYQIVKKLNVSLVDALKQPIEIYQTILGDENLKIVFPFIPIALFCAAIYLFRKNIFDISFKSASDFGVKGTAKWGNPLLMLDGKTLSKHADFSKGDYGKGLEMEEGIIIGKVPKKSKALILPKHTKLDTMNVYVNGPSGSGKGQSYVMSNLVSIRNECIINIDPKGENYHVTSQLKRDQGYRVYQIDFADFSSAKYNPLDYVKNDEDAQKVSDIISKNSTKDGKEDFFKERAQKLLAGLISYVKSEFPKEQANMAQVINVFNQHVSDPKKCDEWLDDMPDENPAKGLLISVLGDLTSMNTRSGISSSFQSMISIFQLNRIKEMTKTSDFSFDEFQKHKSVLYVKIAVPTNPYASLTSVFFSQMIDRFFELGDINPIPELDIPVHFLLDEFPNIGKIDGYENTLSLCRGYKIYMHTIVQDISQLQDKKLYGKEATKTIISNHSAILILKVGEKEGAKYWSDWIDATTVKYKSESTSVSKQGKTTNRSDVYEKRALLPANELMSMEKNIAYLLLKGKDPLKIEKAWQYDLYPGLLFDENRKPNYNQNRKSLGYKTPVKEENINKGNIDTFEDYQKQRAQQRRLADIEVAAAVSSKSESVSEMVVQEINSRVAMTSEDEKEFNQLKQKKQQEENKKPRAVDDVKKAFENEVEQQRQLENTHDDIMAHMMNVNEDNETTDIDDLLTQTE
ncbi:type IV secretion system protein VirD4 [Scopulibacillus darangshiensis]|uniref:Type IV secretion system protein VirD4 n=1 Tax=Scopulibacillus darangshiensis TaxID=442528 RepID=A0A4R2NRS3_9BACL|nr:type IV secretory system conjugative DNA transfer family protein [Scopulibacillus darangshiensis]TCP24442.1 type IV secretion system protein VirD4 [Scopulibacillus darangshiensis]